MKRALFFAACFCLLLIPPEARACSCLTGDPPVEFNRAKAVFVGRMLGGTEKLSLKGRDGKPYPLEAGAVRFSVEEVFKGDVSFETVLDVPSMDGTSCGPYGLRLGAQYVVYAYARRSDEEPLYTGVCTRTKEADGGYAKADLDFLRTLPPPGTGGNLRGRIWADLRAEGATPLPGVKVNVRGPDGRIVTAVTDQKGEFELKLLKPGKYKVEPALPEHYTTVELSSASTETDERGRFSLEGFTGEGYRIEARGSKKGGREGEAAAAHSPSKNIAPKDDLKNVKMVMSEAGRFGAGCR